MCGIKVQLIFDLSASIDGTELTTMKNAAKDFVSSLQGTPTQVSINTFGTDAPVSGQTLGFTSVVTAGRPVDTVNHYISGPPGSGISQSGTQFTNWHAALRQAGSSGADMAIVLTDGDPTAYGTGQDPHGPPSNVIDVENAVPSSNAAKTAGVNIVGVGITNGASVNNMKSISYDGSPYYFTAANFSDLGPSSPASLRRSAVAR